jgi:Tfp pilus assembly protein PilV
MGGFRRKRKGVALLEVLIAGVILAVVLVGFMQGLNVTILGTDRDSKMNSAQHIAQSQMEYIKSLPYDDEAPFEYGNISHPKEYHIMVAVDPDSDYGNMTRLQLITVTVSYKNVNAASQDYRVVLKNYKIDR